MASNEKKLTLTNVNTTGKMSFPFDSDIAIQGVFSGGTVTHYVTNSLGRGPKVRTATTVAEAYTSSVVNSEFEVTGADGSTSIIIIGTPKSVDNKG